METTVIDVEKTLRLIKSLPIIKLNDPFDVWAGKMSSWVDVAEIIDSELSKINVWLAENLDKIGSESVGYLLPKINEAISYYESSYDAYKKTVDLVELGLLFAETELPPIKEKLEYLNKRGALQGQQAGGTITDEVKGIIADYFKGGFKQTTQDNVCYFDEFIKDIQKPMTAKDKATLLLLAYKSDKVNPIRVSSFAEWLRLWSGFLNYKIPNYKESQLDTTKIERLYYYFHKRQ